MVRGLYTSAVGMTTQMQKMDVVSNNIANVDTTGFKRDIVITRSFSNEMMRRLHDDSDFMAAPRVGDVSLGIFVDNVHTDFSTGALQNTGGDLDFAIAGEGFFVVQYVDNQNNIVEKYTRDGAFTLSSDGTILTKTGEIVLGNDGPIVLESGNIIVDESGNIINNGEIINSLRIVDFEDKTTLRKFGDNLFDTTDDSVITEFTGTVLQNFLEGSNINPVKEMIEMITLQRVYEANQRMIGNHDIILGKAVNEIGRR